MGVIGLSFDNQLYLTDQTSTYPDLSSNIPVVTIKAELDIDPFGEVHGNGSFHNINGSRQGLIDLEGVATAASSIRLSYEASQGEQGIGDIELLYQELYDTDADPLQLDNTWTATKVSPVNLYSITLRVSGSGAIIGEDINNCDISGQLETIDAQVNLYTANLIASNCPEAFDRSGYAYVEDGSELFMALDYQNGLIVHRLTPPPPDEVANGVWEGTFTDNGNTFDITGLLYDEEIIALSPDANAIYIGSYAVDGYNLSADVTIYEIGGTNVGTASFTGIVNSQSQIALNYEDSSGGNGSVSLLYDEIYERGSSLAKVSGNYVSTGPGYSFSVSISSSGVITGNDTDGCTYDGVISTPDSNFNLYETNIDVSSCGAENGSYSGFAALYDENGVEDGLTVALSNENYIVLADFLR